MATFINIFFPIIILEICNCIDFNYYVDKELTDVDLKAMDENAIDNRRQLSDDSDETHYDETTNKKVSLAPLRINTVVSVSDKQTSNDTASVDMYNVEPALGQLDVDLHVKSNTTQDYTVHQLENFACWDLPLLYGELENSDDDQKVFSIYSRILQNVVHKQTTFEVEDDPRDQSNMNLVNNVWCSLPPCFGDHTLCLFNKRQNSKLCAPGFRVERPKTTQVQNVLNTVNSMRNFVAKGSPNAYPFLPSASNMMQIMYNKDLETIAKRWLKQCLPGLPPCSSIELNTIGYLECTRRAKNCCIVQDNGSKDPFCIPSGDCFVDPYIGCIHEWFWSIKRNITEVDVKCGRIDLTNYPLMQLLWARTYHIGCAAGHYANGDIRVACNFSPGAFYKIETRLYCGLIEDEKNKNATCSQHLNESLVINNLDTRTQYNDQLAKITSNSSNFITKLSYNISENKLIDNALQGLSKRYSYEAGWLREVMGNKNLPNSLMFQARLVSKQTSFYESNSKCDNVIPIYEIGPPGALCEIRGRRFSALCHEFTDHSAGYRIIAVIAPAALFTLILYDLFSGVVKQTNY